MSLLDDKERREAAAGRAKIGGLPLIEPRGRLQNLAFIGVEPDLRLVLCANPIESDRASQAGRQ